MSDRGEFYAPRDPVGRGPPSGGTESGGVERWPAQPQELGLPSTWGMGREPARVPGEPVRFIPPPDTARTSAFHFERCPPLRKPRTTAPPKGGCPTAVGWQAAMEG